MGNYWTVHQDFTLLSLHLNIKKRIIFKNITFFQLHLLMVITCITKWYLGTRGTLTNLAGKLYTAALYKLETTNELVLTIDVYDNLKPLLSCQG